MVWAGWLRVSCRLRRRQRGIETMEEYQRTYIPAAGRDWALPLYDPIVKLFGGDHARKALLDQSAIQTGYRVLDIGCGTGSLVALIKRLHPDVDVVGLDPDPKALARARRKTEQTKALIQLDQGFSDDLPYPDASFDRVFSSFMLHHLQAGEREKTLREVRRVLKSGGSLHLLDFAGLESSENGFLARLFHSSHSMKDNSDSRIIALMSQAGLANPRLIGRRAILFGQIAYYQASAVPKP
jgi:ubiquinone/menaquinone biosynthesis C-methylase UbiE